MRTSLLRLPRAAAALALALAAAGCGSAFKADPGPVDRFYFPSAMALHGSDLLVLSTNFDLAFDTNDGGSVLLVDPEASPQGGLAVKGALRVGSFGGPIVIADKTACGLAHDRAFFATRADDALWRVDIGDDGTLSCPAAGCREAVPATWSDPFAVAVTCTADRKSAWVSYLRGPLSSSWLHEYPLDGGAPKLVQVPTFDISSFLFDADRERLWLGYAGTNLTAPLRWIDLGGGCAADVAEVDGGCHVGTFDLSTQVRGSDITSMAWGHPVTRNGLTSRRLYVGMRLYDEDIANVIGSRPARDIGGVLAVFDVAEGAAGTPVFTLAERVEVGAGLTQVAVLPPRDATGTRRDVVVSASLDEGLVVVYDDEDGHGIPARVFGHDPVTGNAVLGRKPYAVVAEPVARAGNVARVYVSAFDQSFVTPVDVPLDAPATAHVVEASPGIPRRIGQERK